MTIKELIPVDCDLIRDLRNRGKDEEARNLLHAYHVNLEESWKETRKQMKQIDSKVTAFKLRKANLCYWCKEKQEEAYKKKYCEKCYKLIKGYKK